MNDLRFPSQRRMRFEDRANELLIAVERKTDVRAANERDGGGWHNNRRSAIATHRIQRYANRIIHPGEHSKASARVLPPGRRRDNSRFGAQRKFLARRVVLTPKCGFAIDLCA
jgi:hypothetical protein